MRSYSIARRVVMIFLVVELLSALCMTGFVFLYERHTHFHSLDVALRGRAEMLMGAVVDADDADDRVMLDMEGLQLVKNDLYEVRDDGMRLLGRSPGWQAPSSLLQEPGESREISVQGTEYRAIRLTGLRRVDGRVIHHIVVVYASPTLPAWKPVLRAVRDFALASTLLVLLSALIVTLLVRRSMSPLKELAAEASLISSSRWHFAPPERARHTEELAALNAALEDLVRRLQISFAQQRQFVSDSAHELKTAVTVVKSSLQLLELRERHPEEYRAGVLISLADCLRMEELVHRMLALARVEEGIHREVIWSAMETDLSEGAQVAMASIDSFARLKQVRLDLLAPAPIHAAIAPDDWQSVCTNLLSNSIQHSSPGTRVLLSLTIRDEQAVCQVIDCGDGIAPEALPHVFDRFYRGDASRARSTGGSGLGLAIAKAIVTRGGGELSIASTPGAGTTATIKLPLVTPGRSLISVQTSRVEQSVPARI